MRTHRHLALATLALVALTGSTLGSSKATGPDPAAGGGGRANNDAGPNGPTAAVDLADPAATGAPTSPPDKSRHDAMDPRSSDQGLSAAASRTSDK